MVNMIIAGVGGQGVNSLTRVVAEVARAAGWQCQFTVHKGGAQSLGTVVGELRLWQDGQDAGILGAAIAPGQLDCLIALDPWEALRHLPLAHGATCCWVERDAEPFFMERHQVAPQYDALTQLQQIDQAMAVLDGAPGWQLHWRHYRQQALQQYGRAEMANFFAGLDCIAALQHSHASAFDWQAAYQTCFFAITGAAPAGLVPLTGSPSQFAQRGML